MAERALGRSFPHGGPCCPCMTRILVGFLQSNWRHKKHTTNCTVTSSSCIVFQRIPMAIQAHVRQCNHSLSFDWYDDSPCSSADCSFAPRLSAPPHWHSRNFALDHALILSFYNSSAQKLLLVRRLNWPTGCIQLHRLRCFFRQKLPRCLGESI